MKKHLVSFCLWTLALTGCAGNRMQTAQSAIAPGQTAPEVFCPWNYNVVEQAVSEGEMHYYFMSGEGVITSGNELEPEKWGDCCLIVFPDGQTMLIDCGVRDFGPVLVENLRRMGIERLDSIVITHPHTDHQNGIFHPDNLTGEGVLDRYAVGRIYHRGGIDPKRDNSYYVQRVCAERGILLEVLEMGDTLQLGDVSAQVLWPKVGTSEKEITGTANVNNSSIVLRFDYREHASLFAGDLYDDGEFALLCAQDTALVDVDLLKAPHHGGYTSGSAVFLGLVSPELTVATGFEQIRDDVAARYAGCGTQLLGDRTYGYIHIATDGDTMTWESSREKTLPTA